MAPLADQLARLATLSPAELRQEWQRLYRTDTPSLSPDLLRFGLAHRMQEKVLGALSPKATRALNRIAAGKEPTASPAKAGTQLVRSWNGRTISVETLDNGFLFEERTYASLSAIAREVTGAHWSGPRFFGLRGNG